MLQLSAMLGVFSVGLLYFLSVSLADARESEPRKLTIAEAKEIALAALTDQQRHLPRLGLESDTVTESSRYIFITATWVGEPRGSVVVDSFAVDRLTADIWSATISCLEKKNTNIYGLQSHFRKEINLSLSDYQKIKTNGPLCEN